MVTTRCKPAGLRDHGRGFLVGAKLGGWPQSHSFCELGALAQTSFITFSLYTLTSHRRLLPTVLFISIGVAAASHGSDGGSLVSHLPEDHSSAWANALWEFFSVARQPVIPRQMHLASPVAVSPTSSAVCICSGMKIGASRNVEFVAGQCEARR